MLDLKSLCRAAASVAAIAGLCLATAASAQTKPRIEKAADLPRFTYKVEGPLEDIVRSADKFAPLAAAVRRDTQGVLDKYDIPDRATKRSLITLIAILDYLDRRYDDALARAEEVRALQDKPADKLPTHRCRSRADRGTLYPLGVDGTSLTGRKMTA